MKLYFNWLFFCTSITRDTLFAGNSLIFLPGTLELFVGNVVSLTPSLSSRLGRVVLCPRHRLFNRVQSPRNLAHSYQQPIVQLFLPALSLFAPRLGHLRCHSGPGLPSTSCSRESCFRRLSHFPRRQEFHRGLPTRSIPCRYRFLHGCR